MTRVPVNGNVTIIFNERDVVVDAGASPTAARAIIRHIRSVTENDVSVVVNIHRHDDHKLRNQEFVRSFPGVEIIATTETYTYLTSGRMQGRVRAVASGLDARVEAGRVEISRLLEGGSAATTIAALLNQFHGGCQMDATLRSCACGPLRLGISGIEVAS